MYLCCRDSCEIVEKWWSHGNGWPSWMPHSSTGYLCNKVTYLVVCRDWSGLQTLLLDHNGLTYVDPCWSKIAWLLQTIDISGNPIVCDCNLKYLKGFSKQLAFHQAQCAQPDDFAGNFVDTIPAEKYNCTGFPAMEETSRQCDHQCHVSTQQIPNGGIISLASDALTVILSLYCITEMI